MPIIVWIFGSLMVAAIAAAFAFALQLAETKRRLQRAENDLTVALSEQSTLNKKYDQEKADIQAMADARISELTEMITQLSHTDRPLNEIEVNILSFIFKHSSQSENQIATSFRMDLEAIKYHLGELQKMDMVSLKIVSGGFSNYYAWVLEQKGRQYVIDHTIS